MQALPSCRRAQHGRGTSFLRRLRHRGLRPGRSGAGRGGVSRSRASLRRAWERRAVWRLTYLWRHPNFPSVGGEERSAGLLGSPPVFPPRLGSGLLVLGEVNFPARSLPVPEEQQVPPLLPLPGSSRPRRPGSVSAAVALRTRSPLALHVGTLLKIYSTLRKTKSKKQTSEMLNYSSLFWYKF